MADITSFPIPTKVLEIVDNLTSTDTDKPLSANQGLALKGLQVQAQAELVSLVEYAVDISSQAARQVNGGHIELRGGSAADPSIRINDIGIYSTALGQLSIAVAGVERLRITSAGITVYGTVTEA